MNGCYYIKENFGLNDDDIIITHDAVRPFITYKIIEDNIDGLNDADAVDTCIKTTDTIVEVKEDLETLDNIPNRKYLFNGQTPQTFKLKKLLELHDKMNEDEKSKLTDACKIFVLNNQKVKIVKGEEFNIKITNMFDLKLANAILLERGNK